MATKKKTSAKRNTQRNLRASEYDKFFGYIGKARVMAYKISNDPKYTSEVRRAMRSVESKLWALGNDYYWRNMTESLRGN